MSAYSLDLIEKIVESVKKGLSKSETARRFSVDRATVKRYCKQLDERGTLQPRKAPGKRPKLDEKARKLLLEDLQQRPWATHSQRAGVRLLSNLQEQIATKVEKSYSELVGMSAAPPLVSPFAALVFERAGDEKQAIIREMQALRKQAAGLRKKVRDIEIRWQGGSSAEDAAKAKREWKDVLEEISEEYWTTASYKRGLGIVTGKWSLKFIAAAARFATGSLSANVIEALRGGVDLVVALSELPTDALRKLIRGGTVVEMHRVLPPQKVPNPKKLPALIEGLFDPTVENDDAPMGERYLDDP